MQPVEALCSQEEEPCICLFEAYGNLISQVACSLSYLYGLATFLRQFILNELLIFNLSDHSDILDHLSDLLMLTKHHLEET